MHYLSLFSLSMSWPFPFTSPFPGLTHTACYAAGVSRKLLGLSYTLVFGMDNDTDNDKYLSVWGLGTRRIINCVEFDLVNAGKYQNIVKVECLSNGVWIRSGECSVGVSRHQVVAFPRNSCSLVKIILTKKAGCIVSKSDLRNVHAAFM